jgi:hypothetical protein
MNVYSKEIANHSPNVLTYSGEGGNEMWPKGRVGEGEKQEVGELGASHPAQSITSKTL